LDYSNKYLVQEDSKDSILVCWHFDTNVVRWRLLHLFWGDCEGGAFVKRRVVEIQILGIVALKVTPPFIFFGNMLQRYRKAT
jgi:hypothetical protein